jgi:hypothetical protein
LQAETNKKGIIMETTQTRKRTAAENRAINSKKTPRSRRMKYALEHAGAFIILDPELRAQLKSCEP